MFATKTANFLCEAYNHLLKQTHMNIGISKTNATKKFPQKAEKPQHWIKNAPKWIFIYKTKYCQLCNQELFKLGI